MTIFHSGKSRDDSLTNITWLRRMSAPDLDPTTLQTSKVSISQLNSLIYLELKCIVIIQYRAKIYDQIWMGMGKKG